MEHEWDFSCDQHADPMDCPDVVVITTGTSVNTGFPFTMVKAVPLALSRSGAKYGTQEWPAGNSEAWGTTRVR